MPTLIAQAMASAGWIAAGSVATAATVISYTAVAASIAYSQNQQRKARRAASDMASRGREFSLAATDTARSLIVGRASVPVERIVYMKLFGERREKLVFVAAFGAHEIDALEDILFNNESIGPLDGNGAATYPSKYAKTDTRARIIQATFPPPTGQITLSGGDTQTYEIVSVARSEDGALIPEGVNGWVLAPTGTGNQLLAANNSGQYTGWQVTITYRAVKTTPLVTAKAFLGNDAGERDLWLEALDPDDWTASDIGRGVPRVRFELTWDSDVFGPIGFPDIRFIVRGAKCPTFTGGGPSWTQNSARALAWFLMREEGFGAQMSDIDATLAAAAQNACDEAVPYEDGIKTQPRYTCNGVIDTEANPVDTLRQLVGSMAGRAVPVGGKWDLYAGVAGTPAYTLEDGDLAGEDESLIPTATLGEMVNCVRGRYVNGNDGYVVTDAAPYESPTYMTQDAGAKRWLEVDLPFTTDTWTAQRIQRIMLHKARNSLVWETVYNLGALPARAGMTVRAKHAAYGWDALESGQGKRFEIQSHDMRMDGTVRLAMVETAPEIYDWTYDEAENPDPTPNTSFPDPSYIPPVTGLSAFSSENTYDLASDGTKDPYVLVSWAALPEAVQQEAAHILVAWKFAAETAYREERVQPWETSIRLRPALAGNMIDGWVQVVSPIGVRSDRTFFVHNTSAALNSGIPTISANRVINATFSGGTKGWSITKESGTTDAITIEWPAVDGVTVASGFGIAGSPRTLRIFQNGTQDKYSSAINEPVSIRGGARYAVFGQIYVYRCSARMQVALYTEQGTWIRDEYANLIEFGADFGGRNRSSSRLLANYRVSAAFFDAPPNAAQAYVKLIKFGTREDLVSLADLYQPFLGEVPAGSMTYPDWDPGGMPSINTGQLEIGAATEVRASVIADIAYETTAIGPPGPWSGTVASFVPAADGVVEVVVSGMVTAEATTATDASPIAWLDSAASIGGSGWLDDPGGPPGFVNPSDQTVRLLTVRGNSVASGGFTVVGTFQAVRGVAFTVVLRVGTGAVPVSVPISGPVTKPLPTTVPAKVRLSGMTARATLIKA